LESELLNGIHERFVRSFLDFVILMELRKRPLDGHDIITLINNRHHITLSSDTIDLCFDTLEKDELVKSRLNLGKRIFTLTERGEEAAIEFLNAKTRILGLLLNLFVDE